MSDNLDKQLTDLYDKLEAAVVKLNAALERNNKLKAAGAKVSRKQKRELDALNKEVTELNKQYKTLGDRVKADKKAMDDHNKTIKTSGDVWTKLSKVMSAYANTMQALAMFKNILDIAKAYDKLNFTYKTIISNTYDLIAANGFLMSITEEFGSSLRVTSQQYIKFKAAADAANLATKDTNRIFKTVTKAGAVLGLTTDELRTTYLALEQMLSKGKVTTEELRRQLGERLPGAFNIMAKAVGVTTAELDTLLKKGEIISADVLPKFAEQLERSYKLGMVDEINTLQAATTRLTTSWEIFVSTLVNSEGALSTFFVGVTKASSSFFKNLALLIQDDEQRLKQLSKDTYSEETSRIDKLYDEEKIKLRAKYKDMKDYNVKIAELDEKFRADSQIAYEKSLEEEKALEDELTNAKKGNYDILKKIQSADLRELVKLRKIPEEEQTIAIKNEIKYLRSATEARVSKLRIAREEQDVNKKALSTLEQDLARRKGLTSAYKEQAGLTEKIDAKGESGVAKRTFIEKSLTGEYEKQIELLSIQIDLQQRIQKDKEMWPIAVEKALMRELELTKQLYDVKEKKEIAHRENWTKKEIERASKAYEKESLFVDAYGVKRTLTENDLNDYIKKLKLDLDAWKVKIDSDYNDKYYVKQLETQVKIDAAQLEGIKLIQKLSKQQLDIESTSKLNALKEEYVTKGIYAQGYSDKLYALDQKRNADSLKDTKKFLLQQQKILNSQVSSGVQFAAEGKLEGSSIKVEAGEKQVKAASDALAKLLVLIGATDAALLDLGLETIERQREKTVEILETVGSFVSEIGSLLDAFHDRRMDQIEAEQEAEDEKYNRLDTLARDDADRQEALALQKEAIDARLEKKRRKAERENAIRKKAQSLVEIALNTAIAVTRLPAEGGLLGLAAIPIVLTLGALQAAAVLAQPLPRLKKGRKDGPATFAIVGDGGKSEVIERKDGSISITDKKDELAWLDKGDKVHSSVSNYRESLIRDIRNDNNNILAFKETIEDSIAKGFKKAKINNHNHITTPSININHALWKNQQTQF